MKVFLSGEGPDDLGDWYRDRQNWHKPPEMGIIEALLRVVDGDRFTVVDARIWKRIKKFKSGKHRRPETRNVLGLMLEAEERGCDLLVFVRDQDGYEDREADINEGVRLAREGNFTPDVVGGVAVQEIEAWILALLGERGSEAHADAKQELAERHRIVSLAEKVAVVEGADIHRVPMDAVSLRDWLNNATVAFVMKR